MGGPSCVPGEDLFMNDLLLAFAMTLIAGLSTGIGSLIAFLAKRTSRRFLSVSLGFSAGVMVYVSMVEILATARGIAGAAMGRARRRVGHGSGVFRRHAAHRRDRQADPLRGKPP